MTTNDKTGGPAFPVPDIYHYPNVPIEFGATGMTMLDAYSIALAQGMAASEFWERNCDSREANKAARKAFCEAVFAVAQDMLAERERVMKELNQ